jgi:hypothetical protein
MILPPTAPKAKAELAVDFTPKIVIEQSHTDNFFQDSRREVDMWVTRVAPGFELKAKTDNSLLLLNYLMGRYWHFTDEPGITAADQNFFQHELSLGVATQPSVHWRPGFTEELIKSREPLLSEEGLDLPLPSNLSANLIDFTRNRVKPFMNFYLSERWEAKFAYRNEIFDLSSNNPGINGLLEDQKEHRTIVTLTHNLNGSNHLDLENQFWHRDFETNHPFVFINTDYDSFQTKLIYRRNTEGSPYEFQIGAGYQFRDFKHDVVNGLPMDSLNEFVFSTELSRKTKLSEITLAIERTVNDFTISNNYYTSRGVTLSLQRYFHRRKFRLFTKAGYEFKDYLTNSPGEIPREDDIWEVEGGVAYKFLKRRLELALGCSYEDRDSNHETLSYAEKKVFLKLEAKYDFYSKWK